jgi:CheY-like chemotaxis protein/DNA-directed RNA polymerase specialized sigma24 family protein
MGMQTLLTQELVSILPYLRRYARALTGSQEFGDHLVSVALENLKSNQNLFEPSRMRVSLYREVSRLSDALPTREEQVWTGAIDRRLQYLTLKSRKSFLLVALELFDPADAAAILEMSGSEFADALALARHEVAVQAKGNVLIIEDEFFIASDIERILQSLGHNIVGIERTHRGAVRSAKSNPPSLILADIKLADDSDGIEAVNEILCDLEVPVVFVTAYPERFLTGKRPEPAFLISKPYAASNLGAIVSQAMFLEQNASARHETPNRI